MPRDPLLHPEDNPAYYMAIWKSLLGQLLGWSEEHVESWAERFAAYLADSEDMLFHADPISWATECFIPGWLWNSLKPWERAGLKSRLHEAFSDEHGFEFPINMDWEPFRGRLEQILSKHGASLPVSAV